MLIGVPDPPALQLRLATFALRRITSFRLSRYPDFPLLENFIFLSPRKTYASLYVHCTCLIMVTPTQAILVGGR